jgi:hypothetical protein
MPGDLLVAHLVSYSTGPKVASIFTSGTDWKRLRSSRISGQTTTAVTIFSRTVTASDSGTYNLDLGYDGPFAAGGVVMAFSGVDKAYGPTDAASNSSSGVAMTAGPVESISTLSANSYVMIFGVGAGDASVSWTNWATTSLGPLTELYDFTSDAGFKNVSLGAAGIAKPAPGATGTGSANLSASITQSSYLLALKNPYNTPLISALNAMKAHVEGTATQSAAQISAHRQTIFNNRLSLGSSASSIAAATDLIRTYDDVLGPLWVARSMPNRSQLTNDLHYTIFTLMQLMVNHSYTSSNIAENFDILNGFLFGSSANFPGSCPPPADPDLVHTAVIDGNYLDTFGRAVVHENTENLTPRPTGTYLAPGSIATVTVPPVLLGRGYKIRVGAHISDFSDKTGVVRLDHVSIEYPIDSLSTQVGNPLGGGIYIIVPQYVSDVGVVSVQIKNAVRSPYFSAKSFHQTTLAEWQNTERHHVAPWADFQSGKVMMQVPTNWIYALDDPITLMADWDKAADICNDFMGFPRERGRETIYNQVDLKLRGAAYTPGYPAVNNNYNPNKDYGGYADSYLVRGPQFAPDYEFHEMGHGYRFPKFPGEVESDVNLLHVPVMQLGFGLTIDEAFRASRGGQYTDYATLDTTAIAWMMCDNFLKGNEMLGYEKQYALKGHAKFVEIARLFGWKRLSNYFATFNTDYENNVAIPEEVDSLLMRLSSNVGIDVRPLFHFWGVPPKDSIALDSSVQTVNLPSSAVIYDTLVRYKSLVPPDNATFRTFATSWWGYQPLSTGFSEERNHASRWDAYDEASATATANRAQQIIDLYFPTGRPSDYGDWRSQWAFSNLVDPQFDLDGDGMSNEDERIWGLDPTNAMSRNPIISNSDLISGSFSYSRRSQTLTDLNYTVWTSTNLKDWTKDAGAQQLPGVTDSNGVQSVETTLTPELLENPSLFIQMRASEP